MDELATLKATSIIDPFVPADIRDTLVRFRRTDGFGSLNDLCGPYNKRAKSFLNLPSTKEAMEGIAAGLKVSTKSLYSLHQGGLYRGTWLHPLLLVEAARWCNPAFGIACNLVVMRLLSEDGKTLTDGNTFLNFLLLSLADKALANTLRILPGVKLASLIPSKRMTNLVAAIK